MILTLSLNLPDYTRDDISDACRFYQRFRDDINSYHRLAYQLVSAIDDYFDREDDFCE